MENQEMILAEAEALAMELIEFVKGSKAGVDPNLDPMSWEGDAQLRGAECKTKGELCQLVLFYLKEIQGKLALVSMDGGVDGKL